MSASPEGRAVPFYCPYCGEEDLEPVGDHGAWWCRACDRRWSLRMQGNGPADAEVPAGGP